MFAKASLFAIGAAAASIYALSGDITPAVAHTAPDAREQTWPDLQLRLDTILGELRARDVSGLSLSQRGNRARLIAALRDYRQIGQFPRNYDFPGESVPYFVDRKTGTLCAVAYLIASTGRRDMVDRVAGNDNNVWVTELAGDTAFGGFLDDNGLTLAEAARIQVPYVIEDPVQPAKVGSSSNYNPASAAAIGVSLASAVWDVRSPGRWSRVASLTSGVAALSLGGVGFGSGRPSGTLVATANLMAGGAAVGLATQRFMRDRKLANGIRATPRVNVAPIASREDGAGLSVTLRF